MMLLTGSNLLLLLAIGLAVLSITFWRLEATAFINAVHDALARPSRFMQVLAVVKALPKLAPLAIDVLVTMSFVGLFGLGGGIISVVTALAMSNTASFFIAREVMKAQAAMKAHPATSTSKHSRKPSRTRAHPQQAAASATRPAPLPVVVPARVSVQYPPFVDAYNKRFFRALRGALDAAERACRPHTVGQMPVQPCVLKEVK